MFWPSTGHNDPLLFVRLSLVPMHIIKLLKNLTLGKAWSNVIAHLLRNPWWGKRFHNSQASRPGSHFTVHVYSAQISKLSILGGRGGNPPRILPAIRSVRPQYLFAKHGVATSLHEIWRLLWLTIHAGEVGKGKMKNGCNLRHYISYMYARYSGHVCKYVGRSRQWQQWHMTGKLMIA